MSKPLLVPSPASFPESERIARKAVEARWTKRAESAPMPTEWSVQDHALAIQARVEPLKVIGVDVFEAAHEMVKALWPEDKLPLAPAELAKRLAVGPERLND
jgi:hypothetical protein